MCGIAGILYSDPARPVDPTVLEAMAEAIAHRGPDGEGYWMESGVGLAHRRLSIVDLAGGSQPLGNEDDSIQVVFNGEIYNHAEMREWLIGRGHRFRTRSDTEVLVHLYEELGEAMAERLRGMFAFAIWDQSRRRLLLARDRVGQKPLYIYRDAEKLLFASELKAILAHPDVDRTIDPAAIEDYLAYGMVPGQRSIFRHVCKLLPAHTALFGEAATRLSSQQYWHLQFATNHDLCQAEWQEALTAKIDETVEAHRMSDVPVGALLSGGLDSSILVRSLAASAGHGVPTFSIGFEEERFNELSHARLVAEAFACEQRDEIVSPAAVRSLETLTKHYDEPFADPAAIPTLALARLAAGSVKVALSGDGGDEAFGGYARYRHDLAEARLRARLPAWLRRSLLRPLASVWPKADWLPRPLRAKTRLTNLGLDGDAAYANTLALCRPPLRRRLLARNLAENLNGHRPEALIQTAFRKAAADPLHGMISADVNVLLSEGFLTKIDRSSMAYGLEVRPPLVDHELLEFAATIPADLKVRAGTTKWILRETYRSRLPACVFRRKQGFDVPLDAWFRGPLRDAFREAVLGPNAPAAELIHQPTAQRLFEQHQTGRIRQGQTLWSLLVLGNWAAKYGRDCGPRSVRAAAVHPA